MPATSRLQQKENREDAHDAKMKIDLPLLSQFNNSSSPSRLIFHAAEAIRHPISP